LDYTEMEDPFTVLSALVPDPPSRPSLTPLYPPLFVPETPSPGPSYPIPTTIPLDHALPTVPSSGKHWNIARNVNSRQKARDRDDEANLVEEPSWQVPRDAHATDFGSYAMLAGELTEEMRRRGMTPCTVKEGQEQEAHFDLIREGLDIKPPAATGGADTKSFWTPEKAADGESYLRDLIYGGVDGYSYVRSLAEFMHYEGPVPPLADWVEQNVVDELTGGRHSLIRKTAECIAGSASLTSPDPAVRQAAASLHLYPAAHTALTLLRSIAQHKIDMAALIKTPDELINSEEEWHGKFLKERRKQADPLESADKGNGMEVEEPEPSFLAASSVSTKDDAELEGPEELKEVLDYVGAVIVDVHRRNLANTKPVASADDGGEDPVLRNLRLNLLALAKRAPLDTIALLPKDLVPEHIRQFIPTLGST
jgi:bromodomain-containing protein 7/9